MKKYIFILVLFSMFFSSFSFAKVSCNFPTTIEKDYQSINKIEREFFKYHGYLVFIYYYDLNTPFYKGPYTHFHFKNIVRLAEKKWGKKRIWISMITGIKTEKPFHTFF